MSNAQIDTLSTLTVDIAAHLGPNWTVESDGDNHYFRKSPRFGFHMVAGPWPGLVKAGRVRIGANWVHEDWAYRPHPDRVRPITVAPSRGAATIASEITRRFLPAYESAWQTMNANRTRIEGKRATRTALINQIAEAIGGRVFTSATMLNGVQYNRPHVSGSRINGVEVDFFNDAPEVRFTVSGITVAQALAVAAVLYPERQAAK